MPVEEEPDIDAQKSANDIQGLCPYLLDHSPQPLVALEGSARVIRYLNPAFARLVGASIEDLLGRPFAEAVPECDGNGCIALLDQVLRTGVAERLDGQRHGVESPPVYWSYSAWPIPAHDGRPPGLMLQVTDATEATAFRQQAVAWNEALIVSSTEQHALTARLETLTAQLKAALLARDDALAYVRGIVKTVREPLVVLDNRLCVQSANPAFYHTFHVSPRDAHGQLLYELGNRQWDAPRLRTLLEESLTHDTAFNDYEVEHDFPVIGRKVMLLNARRLQQEGTELILLAIEDVTERRRAERERQEMETRFTSLVKNIKDHSIFSLDPQGRVTSWNVAAEHILGYTEAEVLGRHFEFIFTPEDFQQGMPEAELRAAREQGRAEDERWHLRKDGERFWALGIVSALHDTEGRLIGFSKILRDMTAWKLTEQAMQANEQRLHMALEMAFTVAFEWDIPRNEVRRQHSRLRAAPETPEDQPSSLEDFVAAVHPDDRESFLANLHATLAHPERGYRAEYRLCEPDGRIVWLTEHGYLERDEHGQPQRLIGLMQDVTERTVAEVALQESDRRKDAFLATLAHELRNPLAPLRTGLDLIEALRGDAAACEEPVRIMDRQLGHLSHLVDDLLDVSRISRGKIELRKERVDLADVIGAAREMSDRGLARGDRQFTVCVPSEPLAVEGDRVRLEQIIANLLNNAAKCTDAGGRIDIRAIPRGEWVDIQVQDDGRGIPRERLDSIFEMFSQTESGQGGGLGIGLSLVRGLVEMHGGTVYADSEGPGCGATFTVSLPRCGSARAQPAADKATANDVLQMQGRVLVVDDNRDIAESLRLVLTMLGAEVRVAYDGAEALRICEDWEPKPTHVLMDIGMPGMDGFEAARRLRAKHPGSTCRLIAVTGWGQEEDRQRVREAGFDEHLVKPVGIAELKAVLSR